MLAAILLGISSAGPEPLHIEGRQLVDEGRVVHLRGVTVPSLEGSDVGQHVFRSCRIAIEDWKANCVRIPVSQDRWFGKLPDQKEKKDEYKDAINDIANYVTQSNAYLVINLASSDAGVWGKNLGPHKMADQNSETFWKDVARKFKGNRKILFDLYSHGDPIDSSLMTNGGTVTDGDVTYQAVGYAKLIKDVRDSGAKNILIAQGIYFHNAESMTHGVTDEPGVMLGIIPVGASDGDAQPNIAYALGRQVPAANLGAGVIRFAEAVSNHWIAESMDPTAPDGLISDWLYTPSKPWGAAVKDALIESAKK